MKLKSTGVSLKNHVDAKVVAWHVDGHLSRANGRQTNDRQGPDRDLTLFYAPFPL